MANARASRTASTARRYERRAAPLSPAHRREAIVTAVFPLVADRGTAVTSRELSEAAGVAEGTIFKVFADKDELFRAVLDRVADPEPTEQGIRSIDPTLPYEQRLEMAAELLQRRLVDIWNILSKIGSVGMSIERRTMPVSEATVELFATEPDRIRITPDDAARRFRALIVAFSQPALYEPSPSATELVRFLLHGVGAAS